MDCRQKSSKTIFGSGESKEQSEEAAGFISTDMRWKVDMGASREPYNALTNFFCLEQLQPDEVGAILSSCQY